MADGFDHGLNNTSVEQQTKGWYTTEANEKTEAGWCGPMSRQKQAGAGPMRRQKQAGAAQ